MLVKKMNRIGSAGFLLVLKKVYLTCDAGYKYRVGGEIEVVNMAYNWLFRGVLVLSLALFGAACGSGDSDGEDESDTGSETDSDSGGDTDSDTDTDSDADTDTDTDADTDTDSDTDTDTAPEFDTETSSEWDSLIQEQGIGFRPPFIVKSDGANLLVGSMADPWMVDWDGDGLKDLLVGMFSPAKVRFFKNVGTAETPEFTAMHYLQADGADIALTAG